MIKRISILFVLLFFISPVFSEEIQNVLAPDEVKAREAAYDVMAPYIEKVQAKITSNWHPSKIESPIITVASLRIGKDGDIISFELMRPTGIKEQDDAAIRAIQKSMPFEPLPETFDAEYIEIHYAFDCEKIGIKDYPKEQPKPKQTTKSSEPEVVRFSPDIEKVLKERLQDNEFKLPPKKEETATSNGELKQNYHPINQIQTKTEIEQNQTQEQKEDQASVQVQNENQQEKLMQEKQEEIQTQKQEEQYVPQTQEDAQKEEAQEEIQAQQQEEDKEAKERARIAELYRRRGVAREYALSLQQKIYENWKPVKYKMQSHQYKNNVTAEVQINRTGSLEKCRVVHSMQDKKAENSALKAIEAAAPFVAFPDEIKREKIILRIKFSDYSALPPSYRFE